MKLRRFIFIPALLLSLIQAGCAPLYGPYKGDTGYSEVQLQDDLYDVSFVGNDDMTETESKQYALIRAAEIALLHGRHWFELVQATSQTHIVPSEVPGTYASSGDRHFRTRYYSPGYTVYYNHPEAFLRIRLLAAKTPSALSADQIIHDAQTQENIKFKDLVAVAPATQPG